MFEYLINKLEKGETVTVAASTVKKLGKIFRELIIIKQYVIDGESFFTVKLSPLYRRP